MNYKFRALFVLSLAFSTVCWHEGSGDVELSNDPDKWMENLKECGQIEAEGTFCNWDQTGYVDCIYHEKYWNFYSGGVNWTTCPEGRKCSCFKDVLCKIPKTEICKPLEIIPSWPDVFHISFKKQYVYIQDQYFSQDSDAPRIIKGFTKQDKGKGKVFHKEGQKCTIIQKEENEFAQYTWEDTANGLKYERKVVDKLNPFMPDLKHYQLLESLKTGKNAVRTYYFQKGPLNNWALESFRYWWNVVYDTSGDTILPMTYKYLYADVDMSDTKAYDDFEYQVHETGSNLNTEDWFHLPKQCL